MPCSYDRMEMWDRRVSIGQTSNANSGIVKNAKVHIGKLKLLEDFYVIGTEKDPTTLLLIGRGFLATANAIIDSIQTMADHSQKWHDGTSSKNIESSSNSEGIAAIVRKLVSCTSPCFKPAQPLIKNTHEPLEKDPNDYDPCAPNSHHEDKEVSTDEDVDEWLNAKMGQRMIGKDKGEEEDALIDILKTVVEECKTIYKNAQIKAPSRRTSKIQGVSFVTETEEGDRASVNVMPKLLFEHLKLADLKETNMMVGMADMTKKAPLGIVENILVKINKFLFHSNFVVIDMLEGPNKTMLLGKPFLGTIHAQIDVFKREISLGIGEEEVTFDMNGEICHSRVPFEIFYMASSVQESEYFNPLEIKTDAFSYDSPACLLFEKSTHPHSDESIGTVDSSDDMQELKGSQEDEVGSHPLENVVSRWHVCKPVRVTVKDCEKDYGKWPTYNPDLNFCSGYDVIYGEEESGMLKQWICFQDHERHKVRGNGMIFADFLKVRYENKNIDDDDPYSRRFDVYKEKFDSEIEQLANEYDLKVGSRYKVVEFEVSSTHFHVVAKFCLGVTTLVTP
ncbi:copia protein [Tanacetum coccineum]